MFARKPKFLPKIKFRVELRISTWNLESNWLNPGYEFHVKFFCKIHKRPRDWELISFSNKVFRVENVVSFLESKRMALIGRNQHTLEQQGGKVLSL